MCLVYQPNGTTSNSWNCNDTLPTPTPLPSLAPTASIVITPTPTQFTSTFFSPTTASPPSPPSPSSPVGSVSLSDIDVISFTTSLDSSRTETIVVEGDGDEVVIIIIPRGSATNVQVTVGDDDARSSSAIRSVVVDITGDIDDDITLCFWTALESGEDSGDVILAHYDEDDDCWTEDDDSLQKEGNRTRNGVEEILLCGNTDHFTNFGILLDVNEDNSGDFSAANLCSSDDVVLPILLIILTSVALGTALLIVIVCIVQYYVRSKQHEIALSKKLASAGAAAAGSSSA